MLQPQSGGMGMPGTAVPGKLSPPSPSREAAKECSPARKRWVSIARTPSPAGAKETGA